MRQTLARLALVLALLVAGPALAQSQAPTMPGQTPLGGNNAEMWRAVRQGIEGYVSIPNKQAGRLIQPAGESWRNLRNGPISTYGTWLMLGIIVVLALFFAWRGRIRIERGPSGRLIERFNGLDRFTHWLTAICFILLALTGLNTLYGRYVLLPLLGPSAFSSMTLAGKYVHNFVSFGFMLGILMMFVLWVKDNIPRRADFRWLAMGGGLFSRGRHAPAYKFNAGQKLLFWAVIGMGALMSVSGVLLLFPFYFVDLPQMQLAEVGHAVVAILMIAAIIAHIYIGTIGMEGAFSAMGSGLVDENWAREHHNLWVADLKGEPRPTDHDSGRPARQRAPRPA